MFWPTAAFAFEPGTYAPVVSVNPWKDLVTPDWGRVTSSFHGTGDRHIVYIQDLHCNAEVQGRIAALLDRLHRTRSLHLVGVEGGSGPVDVGILSSIPNETVKQHVCDYFFTRGRITGPEYQAALHPGTLDVFGVEEQPIYERNYACLRTFLNEESLGTCLDLQTQLDRVKGVVYSTALSAFDHQRQNYASGRLSAAAYETYLSGEAHRLGLDAGEPARAGDPEQLPEQERQVRDRLLAGGSERELELLQDKLRIIENLVNISATERELEAVRRRPEAFRVRRILETLGRLAAEAGVAVAADEAWLSLQGYLEQALEFYRLADQRSRVFVDRLLAAMERQGEQTAVLVTGGFHAARIEHRLRELRISFTATAPAVSDTDVPNPYFSLLRNQRPPIEKLLARKETLFAPPSQLPDPGFQAHEALVEELENRLDIMATQPRERWPEAMRERLAPSSREPLLHGAPTYSNTERRIDIFRMPTLPEHYLILRPYAVTRYPVVVAGEKLSGGMMFQIVTAASVEDPVQRARILSEPVSGWTWVAWRARLERWQEIMLAWSLSWGAIVTVAALYAVLAGVGNRQAAMKDYQPIWLAMTGYWWKTILGLGRSDKIQTSGSRTEPENVVASILTAADGKPEPGRTVGADVIPFQKRAGSRKRFRSSREEVTGEKAYRFLKQKFEFGRGFASHDDLIHPHTHQKEFVARVVEVMDMRHNDPLLAKLIGQRIDRLAGLTLAWYAGSGRQSEHYQRYRLRRLMTDFLDAEACAAKILTLQGPALLKENIPEESHSYLAGLWKAALRGDRVAVLASGTDMQERPEAFLPFWFTEQQRQAVKHLIRQTGMIVIAPMPDIKQIPGFETNLQLTVAWIQTAKQMGITRILQPSWSFVSLYSLAAMAQRYGLGIVRGVRDAQGKLIDILPVFSEEMLVEKTVEWIKKRYVKTDSNNMDVVLENQVHAVIRQSQADPAWLNMTRANLERLALLSWARHQGGENRTGSKSEAQRLVETYNAAEDLAEAIRTGRPPREWPLSGTLQPIIAQAVSAYFSGRHQVSADADTIYETLPEFYSTNQLAALRTLLSETGVTLELPPLAHEILAQCTLDQAADLCQRSIAMAQQLGAIPRLPLADDRHLEPLIPVIREYARNANVVVRITPVYDPRGDASAAREGETRPGAAGYYGEKTATLLRHAWERYLKQHPKLTAGLAKLLERELYAIPMAWLLPAKVALALVRTAFKHVPGNTLVEFLMEFGHFEQRAYTPDESASLVLDALHQRNAGKRNMWGLSRFARDLGEGRERMVAWEGMVYPVRALRTVVLREAAGTSRAMRQALRGVGGFVHIRNQTVTIYVMPNMPVGDVVLHEFVELATGFQHETVLTMLDYDTLLDTQMRITSEQTAERDLEILLDRAATVAGREWLDPASIREEVAVIFGYVSRYEADLVSRVLVEKLIDASEKTVQAWLNALTSSSGDRHVLQVAGDIVDVLLTLREPRREVARQMKGRLFRVLEELSAARRAAFSSPAAFEHVVSPLTECLFELEFIPQRRVSRLPNYDEILETAHGHLDAWVVPEGIENIVKRLGSSRAKTMWTQFIEHRKEWRDTVERLFALFLPLNSHLMEQCLRDVILLEQEEDEINRDMSDLVIDLLRRHWPDTFSEDNVQWLMTHYLNLTEVLAGWMSSRPDPERQAHAGAVLVDLLRNHPGLMQMIRVPPMLQNLREVLESFAGRRDSDMHRQEWDLFHEAMQLMSLLLRNPDRAHRARIVDFWLELAQSDRWPLGIRQGAKAYLVEQARNEKAAQALVSTRGFLTIKKYFIKTVKTGDLPSVLNTTDEKNAILLLRRYQTSKNHLIRVIRAEETPLDFRLYALHLLVLRGIPSGDISRWIRLLSRRDRIRRYLKAEIIAAPAERLQAKTRQDGWVQLEWTKIYLTALLAAAFPNQPDRFADGMTILQQNLSPEREPVFQDLIAGADRMDELIGYLHALNGSGKEPGKGPRLELSPWTVLGLGAAMVLPADAGWRAVSGILVLAMGHQVARWVRPWIRNRRAGKAEQPKPAQPRMADGTKPEAVKSGVEEESARSRVDVTAPSSRLMERLTYLQRMGVKPQEPPRSWNHLVERFRQGLLRWLPRGGFAPLGMRLMPGAQALPAFAFRNLLAAGAAAAAWILAASWGAGSALPESAARAAIWITALAGPGFVLAWSRGPLSQARNREEIGAALRNGWLWAMGLTAAVAGQILANSKIPSAGIMLAALGSGDFAGEPEPGTPPVRRPIRAWETLAQELPGCRSEAQLQAVLQKAARQAWGYEQAQLYLPVRPFQTIGEAGQWAHVEWVRADGQGRPVRPLRLATEPGETPDHAWNERVLHIRQREGHPLADQADVLEDVLNRVMLPRFLRVRLTGLAYHPWLAGWLPRFLLRMIRLARPATVQRVGEAAWVLLRDAEDRPRGLLKIMNGRSGVPLFLQEDERTDVPPILSAWGALAFSQLDELERRRQGSEEIAALTAMVNEINASYRHFLVTPSMLRLIHDLKSALAGTELMRLMISKLEAAELRDVAGALQKPWAMINTFREEITAIVEGLNGLIKYTVHGMSEYRLNGEVDDLFEHVEMTSIRPGELPPDASLERLAARWTNEILASRTLEDVIAVWRRVLPQVANQPAWRSWLGWLARQQCRWFLACDQEEREKEYLQEQLNRLRKFSKMFDWTRGLKVNMSQVLNVLRSGQVGQDRADQEKFISFYQSFFDVIHKINVTESMVAGLLENREREVRPVHVRKRIEEIMDIHRRVQPNITFALETQSDTPGDLWVRANPYELDSSVLDQILGNAAKYGATRITCRLRKNGRWIRARFEDNGKGISKDRLTEIRYALQHDTMLRPDEREDSSSGVGLQATLRVVKTMGGSMQIESAPEGGTRVEVRLPLEEGRGSHQSIYASFQRALHSDKPGRRLTAMLEDQSLYELLPELQNLPFVQGSQQAWKSGTMLDFTRNALRTMDQLETLAAYATVNQAKQDPAWGKLAATGVPSQPLEDWQVGRLINVYRRIQRNSEQKTRLWVTLLTVMATKMDTGFPQNRYALGAISTRNIARRLNKETGKIVMDENRAEFLPMLYAMLGDVLIREITPGSQRRQLENYPKEDWDLLVLFTAVVLKNVGEGGKLSRDKATQLLRRFNTMEKTRRILDQMEDDYYLLRFKSWSTLGERAQYRSQEDGLSRFAGFLHAFQTMVPANDQTAMQGFLNRVQFYHSYYLFGEMAPEHVIRLLYLLFLLSRQTGIDWVVFDNDDLHVYLDAKMQALKKRTPEDLHTVVARIAGELRTDGTVADLAGIPVTLEYRQLRVLVSRLAGEPPVGGGQTGAEIRKEKTLQPLLDQLRQLHVDPLAPSLHPKLFLRLQQQWGRFRSLTWRSRLNAAVKAASGWLPGGEWNRRLHTRWERAVSDPMAKTWRQRLRRFWDGTRDSEAAARIRESAWLKEMAALDDTPDARLRYADGLLRLLAEAVFNPPAFHDLLNRLQALPGGHQSLRVELYGRTTTLRLPKLVLQHQHLREQLFRIPGLKERQTPLQMPPGYRRGLGNAA